MIINLNVNTNINTNALKTGGGFNVGAGDGKTKSFSLAHKAKDPIAERKEQAFEKARKIVSDAFAGEQKIDAELQELRNLSARLTQENKEKLDQISQNNTEMAELKKMYGVAEDSEQQKDLEILMKKNDSLYDPSVRLTDEEETRYREIMAQGPTQYQSRMMERYEENNRLHRETEENLMAIQANGSAIRFINGERLKTNPIGDAKKAAEKVLEAESEALKGELVGDALDHVQEEFSEKVEEAEKQAEQKAEVEERIEKVQEPATPEDISLMQEQIQAEINKVLEELKLLAEDLKGNAVDKLL